MKEVEIKGLEELLSEVVNEADQTKRFYEKHKKLRDAREGTVCATALESAIHLAAKEGYGSLYIDCPLFPSVLKFADGRSKHRLTRGNIFDLFSGSGEFVVGRKDSPSGRLEIRRDGATVEISRYGYSSNRKEGNITNLQRVTEATLELYRSKGYTTSNDKYIHWSRDGSGSMRLSEWQKGYLLSKVKNEKPWWKLWQTI